MTLGIFIAKRVLSVLPLIILLPLITFALMHLAPGNYFDNLRMNPQISPETIRQYEERYHFDKPVAIQYWFWLKNVLQLDFGYSLSYQQPVASVLGSRLWNTLLLTGSSFLLAWLLAFWAGLWAGSRAGSLLDRGLCFIAYTGLSIPNFFLCLLLLWGAAHWGVLPLGGMHSILAPDMPWYERLVDLFRHMAIPVFVLTFGSFSYLFRLMRSQVMDVADKDFVFYLRALRLPEGNIRVKHVGRNAVNPLVSLFGLELPALFSGAALVEIFTGWPGLGSLMLHAVRAQDLFLVLGNMLMIAVLLIIGNLLADILLVAVDPRIRTVRSP